MNSDLLFTGVLMTILSGLYTLIIAPLELLFEVIFTVAEKITGNPGLSIIFLRMVPSSPILFVNPTKPHIKTSANKKKRP